MLGTVWAVTNMADTLAIQYIIYRLTTCLKNLELSSILTAIREMSGILLKIRKVSGKKSCHRNVAKNDLLLVAYLRPYQYLIASS